MWLSIPFQVQEIEQLTLQLTKSHKQELQKVIWFIYWETYHRLFVYIMPISESVWFECVNPGASAGGWVEVSCSRWTSSDPQTSPGLLTQLHPGQLSHRVLFISGKTAVQSYIHIHFSLFQMKDEELKRLKEALEQHEEKMRRQAEELKRETQEKVPSLFICLTLKCWWQIYQGFMPSHV